MAQTDNQRYRQQRLQAIKSAATVFAEKGFHGSSTRDIASETGLTISTVNTYLKRIFSKLGVHSRVELIARMAGTATIPPRAPYEVPHPD